MTRKLVDDEQYGQLVRRTGELLRRVDEGTLPFGLVMNRLQRIIEGVGDFSLNSISTESTDWDALRAAVLYNQKLRQICDSAGFKYCPWINFEEYPEDLREPNSLEFRLFPASVILDQPLGLKSDGKLRSLVQYPAQEFKCDVELQQLIKDAYRPATAKELASFVSAFPNAPLYFSIVGFGTIVKSKNGDRALGFKWSGLDRCAYPTELILPSCKFILDEGSFFKEGPNDCNRALFVKR